MRRSGLPIVLLLAISSLLLFIFLTWIVIVPSQAQQHFSTTVQSVKTASPQVSPTISPTATAVKNKQRAQQGKQSGSATFWSWVTLPRILIGCVVLLAALFGFLIWSRMRPDEYKKLREKAGRLFRLLARADKKLAGVGIALLVATSLGVSAPLLGVSIPLNQPLLRLAALVLGSVILVVAVVRGRPPRLGTLGGHELLPAFVTRPTHLAQLRDALVGKKGPRPRRVALVGMGGAGKSVLAAEAARDPAIRKAYPEVAWVSVGQQPPLLERQHRLTKQLGSSDAVIDVEDGRDLLRKLLADRACLIIVDDVWVREDVRAFDVVGERSALLITTRDGNVAKAFEMAEVEVEELDDDQALALLAGLADKSATSLLATTRDVAREVGNLALGLTMAGALARDIGWEDVLSLLQAAKLEAFDVTVSGDYRYGTLQKAIQVSIDALVQLQETFCARWSTT
jgi:hypothetical protein